MKYSEIDEEVKKSLKRDWIITNGIGGFCSQSALGCNTRKYHGLLIAPLLSLIHIFCLPKAIVWVRFPSSAPERKEKLEFYITLIFFIGNRKGGIEISPVD